MRASGGGGDHAHPAPSLHEMPIVEAEEGVGVTKPQPVYLQHMPREVAEELDRRYGLVRSGHVSVHKNDGEWVTFEHRDVGKKKDVKP